MIIEKATGRRWAAEVQARIVAPLGLRHTLYPGDRSSLPAPHAESYQQFVPDGPLIDMTVLNATGADASGGMVSSTADLARFWQALQRGQLLRPQQMHQIHDTVLAETLQDFIPGIRHGLGVFWIPGRCGGFWAHPGDLAGTSVFNAVTDDGDRVAAVQLTTGLGDPAAVVEVNHRSIDLMDDLMCTAL
jgi:D-alanyl-D-alanine carboxypeptidase